VAQRSRHRALDAPIPKWRLGDRTLAFPDSALAVPPHGTATCTIAVIVDRRLAPWTPDTPNLHALLVSLHADGLRSTRPANVTAGVSSPFAAATFY
jgi:hypothetical protein